MLENMPFDVGDKSTRVFLVLELPLRVLLEENMRKENMREDAYYTRLYASSILYRRASIRCAFFMQSLAHPRRGFSRVAKRLAEKSTGGGSYCKDESRRHVVMAALLELSEVSREALHALVG